MRHPYEKFIRLELIAIAAAVIIGLIALLKGFVLVIMIAMYLLVFSLISGALVEWNINQAAQAGKHLAQAVLLFIFITYMIFHL